jgi:hypothetical protein
MAGFAELMGEGLSRDDFLQWMGLAGDALKDLTETVNGVSTTLRGVPEIFNFTLASIRAAGTREYIPEQNTPATRFPGGDPKTPSAGASVAIGEMRFNIVPTGDLVSDLANAVGDSLEPLFARSGQPMSAAQIVEIIKPELTRRAQSGSQGSRDLAINWPGRG